MSQPRKLSHQLGLQNLLNTLPNTMVHFLILSLMVGLCSLGYASGKSRDILDRSLPEAVSVFSNSHQGTINQELQMEILAMEDEDQSARRKLTFNNPSEDDRRAVREIDQKHRQRLKEIISIFGWPGIRVVGIEGSCAMWLLVQHQDDDLEFQKNSSVYDFFKRRLAGKMRSTEIMLICWIGCV